MDAIRTVSTTAHVPATAAATSSNKTKTSGTDGAFSAALEKARATLNKGETLTKVAGHAFARIHGGKRNDMCINLTDNARAGRAFDLVWHGNRCFHVYGADGGEKVTVEVTKRADNASKSKTDNTSSSTDKTAGTTTSATTETTSAAKTTARSAGGEAAPKA